MSDLTVDLNLGGIERPKFELLPEGEYELMLTDIQLKPAKDADSGKIVAHCQYEVVGGTEYDGRKIKYFQTINDPDPKNRGFLKVWVEAMIGEPVDSDMSLDLSELIQRVGKAYINIVPRNDKPNENQNNIRSWILPFDTE